MSKLQSLVSLKGSQHDQNDIDNGRIFLPILRPDRIFGWLRITGEYLFQFCDQIEYLITVDGRISIPISRPDNGRIFIPILRPDRMNIDNGRIFILIMRPDRIFNYRWRTNFYSNLRLARIRFLIIFLAPKTTHDSVPNNF